MSEALAPDARRREIERLARLLDARFGIPGTRLRFGLGSLLGLVPGLGDTLTARPSAWMIWKARQLGLSRRDLARMAANLGIDLAVGAIPVIGDVFDLGFKANLRNAAILRAALAPPPRPG